MTDPLPPRYVMPAEWAAHRATWFSWPHNVETWPEELPQVETSLSHAVRALAEGETVHLGTLDEAHRQHVAETLERHGAGRNVVLHLAPTNDAWARDHGAIFVRDTHTGGLVATRWGFNSWGGKYPYALDAEIAPQMAAAFGTPLVEGGMILEGGSLDVNGSGTLITTTACLLNENRNPHLSPDQIEARLRDYLGATHVLWLGDGIAGDDTDGHVDDLTRFVSEDTVVTIVERDRTDENYAALAENRERLETMRLADSTPLKVVELPTPAPVVIRGERMPASYANFYIGNAAVLLPVFDDPQDAAAAAILQGLFPSRKVVPIPFRDGIWGQGALHCLTQQIPA